MVSYNECFRVQARVRCKPKMISMIDDYTLGDFTLPLCGFRVLWVVSVIRVYVTPTQSI